MPMTPTGRSYGGSPARRGTPTRDGSSAPPSRGPGGSPAHRPQPTPHSVPGPGGGSAAGSSARPQSLRPTSPHSRPNVRAPSPAASRGAGRVGVTGRPTAPLSPTTQPRRQSPTVGARPSNRDASFGSRNSPRHSEPPASSVLPGNRAVDFSSHTNNDNSQHGARTANANPLDSHDHQSHDASQGRDEEASYDMLGPPLDDGASPTGDTNNSNNGHAARNDAPPHATSREAPRDSPRNANTSATQNPLGERSRQRSPQHAGEDRSNHHQGSAELESQSRDRSRDRDVARNGGDGPTNQSGDAATSTRSRFGSFAPNPHQHASMLAELARTGSSESLRNTTPRRTRADSTHDTVAPPAALSTEYRQHTMNARPVGFEKRPSDVVVEHASTLAVPPRLTMTSIHPSASVAYPFHGTTAMEAWLELRGPGVNYADYEGRKELRPSAWKAFDAELHLRTAAAIGAPAKDVWVTVEPGPVRGLSFDYAEGRAPMLRDADWAVKIFVAVRCSQLLRTDAASALDDAFGSRDAAGTKALCGLYRAEFGAAPVSVGLSVVPEEFTAPEWRRVPANHLDQSAFERPVSIPAIPGQASVVGATPQGRHLHPQVLADEYAASPAARSKNSTTNSGGNANVQDSAAQRGGRRGDGGVAVGDHSGAESDRRRAVDDYPPISAGDFRSGSSGGGSRPVDGHVAEQVRQINTRTRAGAENDGPSSATRRGFYDPADAFPRSDRDGTPRRSNPDRRTLDANEGLVKVHDNTHYRPSSAQRQRSLEQQFNDEYGDNADGRRHGSRHSPRSSPLGSRSRDSPTARRREGRYEQNTTSGRAGAGGSSRFAELESDSDVRDTSRDHARGGRGDRDREDLDRRRDDERSSSRHSRRGTPPDRDRYAAADRESGRDARDQHKSFTFRKDGSFGASNDGSGTRGGVSSSGRNRDVRRDDRDPHPQSRPGKYTRTLDDSETESGADASRGYDRHGRPQIPNHERRDRNASRSSSGRRLGAVDEIPSDVDPYDRERRGDNDEFAHKKASSSARGVGGTNGHAVSSRAGQDRDLHDQRRAHDDQGEDEDDDDAFPPSQRKQNQHRHSDGRYGQDSRGASAGGDRFRESPRKHRDSPTRGDQQRRSGSSNGRGGPLRSGSTDGRQGSVDPRLQLRSSGKTYTVGGQSQGSSDFYRVRA